MTKDTKYLIDHDPETRAMLDLVRVNAEQQAAAIKVEIQRMEAERSNVIPTAAETAAGCNPAAHLEHRIASVKEHLAHVESVAKDPERHAVRVGAANIAGAVCNTLPGRRHPVPVVPGDIVGMTPIY